MMGQSGFCKTVGEIMAQTRFLMIGLSFLCGMAASSIVLPSHAADAKEDDVAALKAEVARLKGMVTDQSHVMADVSNHYCNLWFAGQAENWPLAQFYCDETRSHLKWAVRVIPGRKDRDGREVELRAILDARSEEHTSELQSLRHLVCRLLLEKKKKNEKNNNYCLLLDIG